MFSYAMQFYIVFIFVTYLMLDSYFSNSMSLTMAKSGSVRLGTYNPSARHQHSKSTKNGFVLCLVGFCFVLLVVSACLLAALILIGKHLSNKNEKLWAVDSVSYDNNITESDFAISRRNFDINDTDLNVDTVQNDETIHEIRKVYRLSNSVRPIHYNLYLFPNLNTSEFIGNVTIEIELVEPTDSIRVHGKSIDLINVILFDVNGTSYTVESVTENRITELWTIIMNATLDPGVYSLGIEFTGDMKNKRIGLYSSEYYDPDTKERRSIATSKFEPTYARQSFPCFDEPNLKAEYTVTLMKPNKTEYIALSNMNVDTISTERLLKQNKNEDSVPVVFKKSVRMSTYLSCFIICDFKSKSDILNPPEGLGVPLKFSVYATPAQKEKTTFALETGMSVIKHYINYFQMEFPLPKLDMVAIPDFPSGAMETWGLVTFRETALLFDNKTNSVLNEQRVATVVAHELAHSWFGNLVTMDWWNDLWLNEGFATYIEYDGVHSVYKDWGMRDQFLINELHTAFDIDGSLSSHPIVQKVENPDEITAIFDAISYSKGSSVLRMLDNMVGNEVFKKGITAYLKKFKFQNAKTQDLFDAIQNISNKINITDVMDTWTRQMGYPEVLVKKEKDSTYILTQNRFLIDKDVDGKKVVPSEYNYRWTIPITYISDRSRVPVQVMFDKSASELRINATASWIKFNAEQVGYYRVNYAPELWKALESNFEKLSVADRTSLLNDAFNLARAGRLPYATAFSLSQRLSDDKDYVTWKVGSREFMNLKKLLYTTDVYSSLRKYVTELATKNYEQLTWTVNDADVHLKRLLRITTLDIACSFDHNQCTEEVGKRFVSWLNNPSTYLHPDIRSLVYSHGMKSAGTAVLWNKMWELFIKESDASEKLKLMDGLASVKDPWLLSRFIDLAWDVSNVRRQDYFTCLQYISANPVGTPLVWDHVRENWQMLVDEFTLNDRYLGRLIPSITSTFNTEFKLQEMIDFFEKYPDAGAGKSARAQALETVRNNIKWLKNYKEDVKNWLQNREKKHFTTTSV